MYTVIGKQILNVFWNFNEDFMTRSIYTPLNLWRYKINGRLLKNVIENIYKVVQVLTILQAGSTSN